MGARATANGSDGVECLAGVWASSVAAGGGIVLIRAGFGPLADDSSFPGASAPANSQNVGSMSQWAEMCSDVDPFSIRPGQRAINGVRMPPS